MNVSNWEKSFPPDKRLQQLHGGRQKNGHEIYEKLSRNETLNRQHSWKMGMFRLLTLYHSFVIFASDMVEKCFGFDAYEEEYMWTIAVLRREKMYM